MRTTGLRANLLVHSSQHVGGLSLLRAEESRLAMKARRTSSDHVPIVPPSIGPPSMGGLLAFEDTPNRRKATTLGNRVPGMQSTKSELGGVPGRVTTR